MPGDLQSTMSSSSTTTNRPTSAPPPSSYESKISPTPNPSTSTLSSPGIVQPSPTPAPMKGRSMQLSSGKKARAPPATDHWGDGNLMDVNADEDDWTAFESAPSVAQSTLGFGRVPTPSFAVEGTPSSNIFYALLIRPSGQRQMLGGL